MVRWFLFAASLALAGCASPPASRRADPAANLVDPLMRVRHVGGDTFTEYREAGHRARIVKITPAMSAPFHLFDDDGDDRIDRHLGQVPVTYNFLLRYRVRFEEYGLIGLPLPPRETAGDCGISVRVPCLRPEDRPGTRPPAF